MNNERTSDQPLDLEEFLQWCQRELALDVCPEPGDDLRRDLGLDEIELFRFVVGFNRLASENSKVTPDVFEYLMSIRDLYLFYLKILSMPRE